MGLAPSKWPPKRQKRDFSLVEGVDGKGLEKIEKIKILRMESSIVENLSGVCGNIFSLFRRSQLHFDKKSKNVYFYIRGLAAGGEALRIRRGCEAAFAGV